MLQKMKNFDKYETKGAYHWSWYQTQDWYRKCVDRCVAFCNGTTLDVGCGDGVVGHLVAEKGHWVTGMDDSLEGINLARTLAKGEYFLKDLNEPIKGKWQYMVCLNVIEHLEKPESIYRIFRDNITEAGIVITDMPQEKPSKYHVKEFMPKELADLFYPHEVKPFQIDENFHGIEVYH